MFAIPLFAAAWILLIGPGINEHGIKAIQDKGYTAAIVQALKEGKPLAGANYGNP